MNFQRLTRDIKAMAHGLTRAVITKVQGGTLRGGFWSGFAASGFSVGTENYGGFVGRTAIMAVVGGTASELGGGKFANGAVSGAFVHMFNAEGGSKLRAWTMSKVTQVEECFRENGTKMIRGMAKSLTIIEQTSSHTATYSLAAGNLPVVGGATLTNWGAKVSLVALGYGPSAEDILQHGLIDFVTPLKLWPTVVSEGVKIYTTD